MLGLAALITALSACGSAESPGSLLEISPASPEVAPGDNVQFTANSPAAPDEPIAWAVVEPAGGTIDRYGVYTAPGAEGTYTVTASLTSLSTTQATQVRVKRNIRVDVSPSAATLAAGESLALTATATGAIKTVTWSVAEGTAGGAITAAGVYTAPGTAGLYNVVATSTADPTKSGSAAITVTAPAPVPAPTPVSVAVSPQTASVIAGNAVQFTATVTGSTNTGVTWSVAESGGGAVSASGLYTAPGTAGTYHVLATSSADTSKTSSATVTVAAAPPPPPPAGVVPAFPGAQGGGALSTGGRGGTVYEVTNVNDSGVGSLRACVDATGPRTCVFRTGGTIQLASQLSIRNPYITIAGQTAPGGGIAISGKSVGQPTMFRIMTHDVVIRYLRIRRGATGYPSGTVMLETGANSVILDHCSLSWGEDETFSIWPGDTTSTTRSITLQWSMVYEGLYGHNPDGYAHNVATAVGSNATTSATMTDIDFHHNYYGNMGSRLPLFKGKSGSWVNNLNFNWGYYGILTGGAVEWDVIGNRFKRGSMGPTSDTFSQSYWPILAYSVPSCSTCGAYGTPRLYLAANTTFDGTVAADPWSMGRAWANEGGGPVRSIDASWRASSPRTKPAAYVPITIDSPSAAESSILAAGGAGASRTLACDGTWVNIRDAADQKQVNDYVAGAGLSSAPYDETSGGIGGFPTLAAGTPCADGDHDGIPDVYEQAACGTTTCLDSKAVRADGYTNLEHYLAGR